MGEKAEWGWENSTSYCRIFMDRGGVVGPAMLRVSMKLRQWECSRVFFFNFFFSFSPSLSWELWENLESLQRICEQTLIFLTNDLRYNFFPFIAVIYLRSKYMTIIMYIQSTWNKWFIIIIIIIIIKCIDYVKYLILSTGNKLIISILSKPTW